MNALRNFALVSVMFLFGGCTAFDSYSEVNALNEAQAVGSPFTQALAEEYRMFANSELKEMFDYPDALHFARKGLAAASGELVLPEPISDWNLNEYSIQELSAARGRLILAFDWGARETDPATSAKAQAAFDCWIEQQEEQWQQQDIKGCRLDFTTVMNDLESRLQPPTMAAAPAFDTEPPAMFDVDTSEPMQPENAMYLVFFDWDSSKITVGAENVINAVADEVAKNAPVTIRMEGHTDTSGPKGYNEKLAFKRANKIRDALVARGVDPSLIVIEARGENELLVPTADNVREPANRRVNISFN